MAQAYWQKIKLVKLLELLRTESDEQHPLTTKQICTYMTGLGIPCERRVVSKDIALLNENGYEILETWIGKSKAYYIEDRSFSIPELKILIDAVQAANFITEKKTLEIIDKIAALGGNHKAEILRSNLVCFNTHKHSNESVYYNVDALEEALLNQRKVTFRYFDINIEHQKVYRREGQHYVIEPIALVYNEDNYYVISYSPKYDDYVNYRIDRMDGVEVLKETVSDIAIEKRNTVTEYTKQVVKMYGGEEKTVTLEFDQTLLGSVYDRFGEDINMMPTSNQRIIANVNVQLSPTFWGWVFQFGKQMRIISPEEVVKDYQNRIQEIMS